MQAWPVFVVGKVGTDLHTSLFDAEVAKRLRAITAPHGSLVKGHYTDWVDNPEAYPTSGMGGANVGPEFTAEEAKALRMLCDYEAALARSRLLTPSRFYEALTQAVVGSGRWRKWLQSDEPEEFDKLSAERQRWLVTSGARYVWTQPQVVESRSRLYENLTPVMGDPHGWVVDRIAASIEKYVPPIQPVRIRGATWREEAEYVTSHRGGTCRASQFCGSYANCPLPYGPP